MGFISPTTHYGYHSNIDEPDDSRQFNVFYHPPTNEIFLVSTNWKQSHYQFTETLAAIFEVASLGLKETLPISIQIVRGQSILIGEL